MLDKKTEMMLQIAATLTAEDLDALRGQAIERPAMRKLDITKDEPVAPDQTDEAEPETPEDVAPVKAPARNAQQVLAFVEYLPAHDPARRTIKQAQYGEGGRGLAAAGLPHQAKGLPLPQAEADIINRLHLAVTGREVCLNMPGVQYGIHSRA